MYENIFNIVEQYAKGVHLLNKGATESELNDFEDKYQMNLPTELRELLKISNGFELYALPVGTCVSGIVGNGARNNGVFYLEDNFDMEKRAGVPGDIFMIAIECNCDIIGIDPQKSTLDKLHIIELNPETGKVVDEWDSVNDWLMAVIDAGQDIFDFNGNEI